MSTHITKSVMEVCQQHGMKFHMSGGELYALCPFHQDGKRGNFRVDEHKNAWFCDVCGMGGGVVEFLAALEKRPKKEVYKELADAQEGKGPAVTIVSTYDYHDRFGALVYQVCRLAPKSFRQRRPDGKGGWVWKMEGVERVLYRLPDLLKPQNKHVWVVEGEKDVETIRKTGMAATTNVGGAGKWCDGYSACLKDKDVLLCGDADDAGRKHVKQVAESLEAYAASIRNIELPAGFKDVSDYAASFGDAKAFYAGLLDLVDKAPVILRGSTLPIKSMAELEQEYGEHVVASRTRMVALSDWIPGLRCVRPLVAGELVSVVGDTGTAKTYVLQHIAYHCRVPTLLFELELPNALTFERFVAVARKTTGQAVFDAYNSGRRMDHSDISHVFTCAKSRLTPEEVEALVLKAELKIGHRPTLVLVDYIQLMKGFGKSRYERVSEVAEQLKVVAKSTGCVIVMASQVNRVGGGGEPSLHDAKDSGSIENSSGVVLGIWRDEQEDNILHMKVLKNTKGTAGIHVKCLIIGQSMRIVEMDDRTPEPTPDEKFQ